LSNDKSNSNDRCSTAFLFVSPAFAQVETWKIDPAHSPAQFAVRHLGISTVRGEFRKVSGGASYDPADLSKTSLEATIDATTVDTRVDTRDNDLRSPNFLDVQKYPTIAFRSKRAESAGPGKMNQEASSKTKVCLFNLRQDLPSTP